MRRRCSSGGARRYQNYISKPGNVLSALPRTPALPALPNNLSPLGNRTTHSVVRVWESWEIGRRGSGDGFPDVGSCLLFDPTPSHLCDARLLTVLKCVANGPSDTV